MVLISQSASRERCMRASNGRARPLLTTTPQNNRSAEAAEMTF
jgi:hypothetical protein